MRVDDIEFHNVAELRESPEWDGKLLQRVPEAVRTELNEGAQRRMRHPAGSEIRFVPEGPVEVTLSVIPQVAETSTVRVFWGPFQSQAEYVIDETPTTITVSYPDRLRDLEPAAVEDIPFDPRVCRIRLPGEHRGGYVCYHGVEGDRRAPRESELPDRRYLAYGTSITEGEAALAEHLTYVDQTAQRLDADLINLGSCGTAYCDAAMADHIAGRDDWDVATLSLSVNMVGTFPPEQFRERAEHMVETVAAAHPETPIACITLFPHSSDVMGDEDAAALCDRFREELRDVVATTPHENVHCLEGPDLLGDLGGLTTDLVHPGDNAMIRIGERLAAELEPLLADED